MIRIIGGLWRGAKLSVLESPGLRPTADRSRETFFNWMQHEVRGVRCLDLFAGTGALSFEALSRGADQAILCEIMPRVMAQLVLQREKFRLREDRCLIHAVSALDYIRSHPCVPVDWIMMDPPFAESTCIPVLLQALSEYGWLDQASVLYIESPRGESEKWVLAGWGEYRRLLTRQARIVVMKKGYGL